MNDTRRVSMPRSTLIELLQHVDDLRAACPRNSDTNRTMLRLGKPVVERAAAALDFAKVKVILSHVDHPDEPGTIEIMSINAALIRWPHLAELLTPSGFHHLSYTLHPVKAEFIRMY